MKILRSRVEILYGFQEFKKKTLELLFKKKSETRSIGYFLLEKFGELQAMV